MDISKVSIDWAKAEVFSAKISLLFSLLFLLAAIGEQYSEIKLFADLNFERLNIDIKLNSENCQKAARP